MSPEHSSPLRDTHVPCCGDHAQARPSSSVVETMAFSLQSISFMLSTAHSRPRYTLGETSPGNTHWEEGGLILSPNRG